MIRNHEGGREVFVASMALRRSEFTRTRMLRLLLRYPPMTVATLARIYVNALRLKLRGAPFHPHPEVRDEQALRVSEQARSRTRVSRTENTKGPRYEGPWLVAGARFVSRYHRLRIRETVRHPG